MKKLFCILIALVILLSFVGCSSKTTTEETSEITVTKKTQTEDTITHATFEVVCGESWDEILYYRDTVTDVMYIRWQSTNEGGLTVMMDPYTNGPLTYTNWLKYQNKKDSFNE